MPKYKEAARLPTTAAQTNALRLYCTAPRVRRRCHREIPYGDVRVVAHWNAISPLFWTLKARCPNCCVQLWRT